MPRITDRLPGKKQQAQQVKSLQQSAVARRQLIAHFHGGPLAGKEVALQGDAPSVYQAPVVNPMMIRNVVTYGSDQMATPISSSYDLYSYSRQYEYSGQPIFIASDWTGSATTATSINYYPSPWQGSWQYPYLVNDTNSYNWLEATPALTQEEADRRLAATRAEQHKNAIVRQRAVKRGRRLLVNLLNEQQKHEYAKTQSFTVIGANGAIYKLRKKGTVHEMGADGRAVRSHCIHLPYSYIDEDTLIALKLMLENDVDEFLRIANTSTLVAPTATVPASGALQTMAEQARALASGMDAVNQRFRDLSIAAQRARTEMDTLGRAVDYASYARELEAQVVAEEAGLILPLNAQQMFVAQTLGHAETIGGVVVAA